uniref:Zinc-ribbon 15 domain-containing protein n=1 Tax=Bionectria ochroleuca TaxID=29856 RepID=A0A0B7K312_BIOOC
MFFFFVCGEHTFRKELPGYEGVICQCHHCGNMSGHVLHRRPFFTFCFVPLIPFTISGYKDIVCHICNHAQPLEARPDGPPQPDYQYKQQSAPTGPPQYR